MARVVVMGVSGCGKSTLGALLAEALSLPFVDGDDLHSESNRKKMAEGIPLEDDDRWPWLDDVAAWLDSTEAGVIACSALKRSYRDRIRRKAPGTLFVHLEAPREALSPRVDARHRANPGFLSPRMLDSQFSALEPLAVDEEGLTVDVTRANPNQVCEQVLAWLEGSD